MSTKKKTKITRSTHGTFQSSFHRFQILCRDMCPWFLLKKPSLQESKPLEIQRRSSRTRRPGPQWAKGWTSPSCSQRSTQETSEIWSGTSAPPVKDGTHNMVQCSLVREDLCDVAEQIYPSVHLVPQWCKIQTHGWKAENHMQILPGPGYEEVIKVVECRWDTRLLLLHDRDQVLGDLLQLIFSKQTGDLQRRQRRVTAGYRRSALQMSKCRWQGEVLTSPEERTLFRYSRKASSLISLSRKTKVMPFPSAPAVLYSSFRSSMKLLMLYVLGGKKQYDKWILNTSTHILTTLSGITEIMTSNGHQD